MVPLKKIQSYIKQYAEVIANIIQCEVEIVDEELIRIAGTGYFEKEVGNKSEGSVYPHVFLTEESQVIENPKENLLCLECKNRENCTEKLEISSPIFYKGKVLGVIGLVCFRNEDKERIIENLQSYLKFTEQISDFISSKLFEVEEEIEKKERVDILKKIVNFYDKGVIVFDDKGNIIDINKSAIKALKLKKEAEAVYSRINIIPKNEKINYKTVYSVEVNGEKFLLHGEIIDLETVTSKGYKLFIFENTIKNDIVLTEEVEKNKIMKHITKMLGNSSEMKEIKSIINKIKDSSSTVLLIGESGVGKELVAKTIHFTGNRKDFPFIAINCGAIPENLLESELFGYVRGAFSGANNEGRIGKFEEANGGTIFLDEIGEMPLYLQVKLLRVIQEKKIERLGSNKNIDLDIRVMAATNANLEVLVKENKFRKDLYYRLNVIEIQIPPLRERKEDIELILDKFLKDYSIKFSKQELHLDSKLKNLFLQYKWPGNIRELENVVEYLVNMQEEDGELNEKVIEVLKKKLKNKERLKLDIMNNENFTLENVEKELIKRALEKYGTSKVGKNMCAKELGIGIATLYRKIEKYKL